MDAGAASPATRAPRRRALELAAPAAGLLLAFALAAALPSWRASLGRFQALAGLAFAFYALAVARRARFATLPHAGAAVIAVAAVLRLAVLATPPALSDDVYRYVWEGRVLAAGRSPYAHAPDDPALASLRDPVIHPRVNHPELRTIYPPLAEAGFALVAAVSPTVLAMKAWIALNDVALCALLVGLCRARGGSGADALVYAWNPLVVAEYAGSGHLEPAAIVWMIAAFLLAERRPALSAAALVAGALVKLAPLVALPFLWRRWSRTARVVAAGGIAAGLALYLALARGPGSGLEAYAATWRHNESLFAALAAAFGDRTARQVAAGLVALVMAAALARGAETARGVRATLRAAWLAGPVALPWYLGWPLALEPLAPSAPWLALSATALLAYGTFAAPAEGGGYHPSPAVRGVEYGVPLALAAGIAIARRVRAARERG